jgi:molybdopterin-guanine dinucleotide biosynthesis protein A
VLTVLVLAGGKSSRMGQDKAWLDLDGTPLIEHVARRLLPLASEVLFSAPDATPFAALLSRLPVSARVVADRFEGAGPLAGLHAGLSESRSELVLAVATDMPFVNLALIRSMMALAKGCDAVVPLTIGAGGNPEPEPLHSLYLRTCLPAIESALGSGKRRVVSFFGDVRLCTMSPDEVRRIDPQGLSFLNVNTPGEWAEARLRLLGEKDGKT